MPSCGEGLWLADPRAGYRVGSDLTLHYWIDGNDVGTEHLAIADLSVEASLDHIGFNVQEGSACFDNLSVSPAPEPSTLALLASTTVGLLAYAWRRRKAV